MYIYYSYIQTILENKFTFNDMALEITLWAQR